MFVVPKVKFGDVVKEVKNKIDRNNNPYEYYVAGDHMDSEDLTIHRRGCFATDDVGPAFIREFRKGQVLYGSRRTYLKKVAVADFDGVTANTTFVLETKDQNVLLQELLPFIMLTDNFTKWSIGKSKGSTNPYILFSDLADYEFDLPTIEEQRKLATVLWKMFRLKEGYVELQHQSDQLVQSQFIEMFGDPIANPKGWNTKPLSQVAPEKSATPLTQDSVWLLNLDMIESNTGNIISKVVVPQSEIGSSTYPFDSSMVLYSKLRPYLNKVVVPEESGYATTELVGFTPDSTLLNKYFLAYLLRSNEFVAYTVALSGGTRMPRTPMTELRKFACILPPIEMQERFVSLTEQFDKSKSLRELTVQNQVMGGVRCA